MRISALASAGNDSLLVLERTDKVAKVYRVDLRPATNVLGTVWDDPNRRPSIETVRDLSTTGVQVLSKSLVLDLSTIGKVPEKIESLVLLDRSTIMVANDNDFDVGRFDKSGNNVGEGHRSQVLTIALALPSPKPSVHPVIASRAWSVRLTRFSRSPPPENAAARSAVSCEPRPRDPQADKSSSDIRISRGRGRKTTALRDNSRRSKNLGVNPEQRHTTCTVMSEYDGRRARRRALTHH